MSADVARDDPSGMVDRTASSNGVPIYPIEVCEATIAVNETQNPERRHLRVKGSSPILFLSFLVSTLQFSLIRLVNSNRTSTVIIIVRVFGVGEGIG